MPPTLVVVTGPPASGKSSLAREIARERRIPLISKDELKERLYDVLGSADALEETLDRAALAILFSVARSNLAAGVDVLVESNFDSASETEPFRELDARVVQIHCSGDTDELVRAFVERSASGSRHPGHGDDPADAGEVRRRIEAGDWAPLDLPGELVEVDVSRGEIDPAEVARRL